MEYTAMSREALLSEKALLENEYAHFKEKKLSLDLSRGKPGADQLNLSSDMLGMDMSDLYKTEAGFDCRNYGLGTGIPEMKKIFSDLFSIPEKNIFVGGNSSLNLIYDAMVRLVLFGVPGGTPWSKLPKVKFLCPVPGYDRHFAILDLLGFEMITVPMDKNGPVMDVVEKFAREDDSVKGIICIPKYSNPSGITYSDETVERLVSMKAADDFRIIWDNAYAVHDLYEDRKDTLADIFTLAKKHCNEDRVLYFTSTSKISFPGSGVAMLAASDKNMEQAVKITGIETIGFDKLNQLRHARYLGSADKVFEKMRKHAEIIRPKFALVNEKLKNGVGSLGIAEWHNPLGGYFISLDVLPGCAKRVWTLMKEAGVTLTGAGATYPHGNDPEDKNLRLAPTYPTMEELDTTLDVLVCCIKLAAVERLTK